MNNLFRIFRFHKPTLLCSVLRNGLSVADLRWHVNENCSRCYVLARNSLLLHSTLRYIEFNGALVTPCCQHHTTCSPEAVAANSLQFRSPLLNSCTTHFAGQYHQLRHAVQRRISWNTSFICILLGSVL
jgi:hypothetical protein